MRDERSGDLHHGRDAGTPGRGAAETSVPFPDASSSRSRPVPRPARPVAGGQPVNLPPSLNRLIGREREIALVCERLRDPYVRLLTLVGPPGIGKTRLALEAARVAAETFEYDACFVPLAPLREHGLVLSSIAGALGIPDLGGRPPLDSLAAALAERRLLLVLDNFEHLPEAAPAVAGLLAACPALKVLATSRAPLHLYGEHEYPVPPLELPELGRAPGPEALASRPAVALFAERARSGRPDFTIDRQNAAAVAEICVRLEGLPLAIELAAARIRLLTPQAMLARLGRRLTLLIGGPVDLPARQQTLRGAIAWSYDLLESAEQVLFRRLAIFVGGFSLEAAEAVCTSAGDDRLDVLNGVASLVARSLVREEAGTGAERRFGMLETIREYAAEQLQESGEATAVRSRHQAYFLRLVEQAEPELGGPEQAAWFDRLGVEHDNCRAALGWSLAAGEEGLEAGLRLAAALTWFWILRGHLSEARTHLEGQLAASPQPTAVRARALRAASWVAFTRADYESARTLGEASLALWRQFRDARGAAIVLALLGRVAVEQAELDRAAELLGESRAMFQDLGGESGLDTPVARYLAEVAYARGDHQRARLLYEESLAQSQARGDGHGGTHALRGLAHLARIGGDSERAIKLFTEALVILGALNDRRCAAQCLGGLARAMSGGAQVVAAARLFGAAEALREALGTPLTATERGGYERDLAVVRRRLTADAFASARAEGRAMTLEQAVACALHGAGPQRRPTTLEHSSAERLPRVLTAREQGVAVLIARGYTNRQIAAELVIAERTAESHVEHILGKLGLSSRTQVVAWAIEQGLLEEPSE